MLRNIGEIYKRIPPIVLGVPLVFLLPTLAEAVQHVAEYQLGMFTAGDGISAGRESTIRLAFGVVKIIAVLVVLMWTPRYWFHGRDIRRAFLPTVRNLKFLGIVVLAQVVISFVTDAAKAGTEAALTGWASQPWIAYAPLATQLLISILSLYILLWTIAGLLGDYSMAIRRSAVLMHGRFIRTIVVFAGGYAPLFALHYALNYGAMGQPPAIVAAMLVIDALVVGVLAVAMGNTLYVIYSHLAEADAPREATASIG